MRGKVPKLILCILCIILTGVFGGSQVKAALMSGIGETTEKIFTDPNGNQVVFRLQDSWSGGYNVAVTVENHGEIAMDNWAISVVSAENVSNVWNACIKEREGNQYLISGADYNRNVQAGQSVEFGYAVSGDFVALPDECSFLGTGEETVDEVAVVYTLYSDWGSGFNAAMEVKNNSGSVISDWTLEFDFSRTITSVSNAVIEKHEGNHYVLRNAGYNALFEEGQILNIGINGSGGASSDEPANFVLSRSTIVKQPIEEISNVAVVEEALANLQIGFQGKDSAQSVTQNVLLPATPQFTSGQYDNVAIRWSSSNEELISASGTVNRPYEESEWVTLTVTISLEEASVSKEYQLKVVKSLYDDYSTDYIEDYDCYEYLYEFNDWEIEGSFQIYENDEGYMDYLIGSYTDMILESPDEVLLSLYHLKTLMGISDPATELEYVGTVSDGEIIRHEFRQVYQGAIVQGGGIYVVTDMQGITRLVNSSFVQNLSLDVNPTITSEDAGSVVSADYSDVKPEGLYIYLQDGNPVLTWRFCGQNAASRSCVIYVSASDGRILNDASNVQEYRVDGEEEMEGYYLDYRQNEYGDYVYYLQDSFRNVTAYHWQNSNDYLEMPVSWPENGSWDEFNMANYSEEYRNVIDAYDYFYDTFSRRGMDDKNCPVYLFVGLMDDNAYHDLNSSNVHCIEIGNSYWDSMETMIHEFTHGIVWEETQLHNRSILYDAAINEAYADIFGELYDGSPNWSNPTRDFTTLPTDVTECHELGRIVVYAAYYMHSHGLPVNRMEKLWYRSLCLGYTENQNSFANVRKNVLGAATLLGFSSEECGIIVEAFNTAGISGSGTGTTGTNTLSGMVVVADLDNVLYNNSKLEGVAVVLKKGTVGTVVAEAVTDVDGTFTMIGLLPGTYTLTLTKTGYLSVDVHVKIQGVNGAHFIQTVEMISNSYLGDGTASGVISDAATGTGVAGLTLIVRKGMSGTTPSFTTVATAETTAGGVYTLEGLPAGNYCVEIKDNRAGMPTSNRYVSNSFNVKVLGGKTIGNQNATVSTRMMMGQLRIVLEWGEKPRDMDSHFYVPMPTGGWYEVYFGNKRYEDSDRTLIAMLDVDDTTSFGPETTTLYVPSNGDFYFSVYNWSGETGINNSNATVKVYAEAKNVPAYVFSIPTNATDYRWWRVFKYDGSSRKVLPINEFAESGK